MEQDKEASLGDILREAIEDNSTKLNKQEKEIQAVTRCDIMIAARLRLNGQFDRINTIKLIRSATGWGLKEAKEYVDNWGFNPVSRLLWLTPFQLGVLMAEQYATQITEKGPDISVEFLQKSRQRDIAVEFLT